MKNRDILKSLTIAELILRKKVRQISPDAEKELLEWTGLSKENAELYQDLDKKETLNASFNNLTKYNAGAAFDKFQAKIEESSKLKIHTRKWNVLSSIAATTLIGITIALGFYTYQSKENKILAEKKKTTDILPGQNTATLTLSDGKTILLTDAKNGELAEQSGIKITKTKDGELVYGSSATAAENPAHIAYNKVETPRGGQYQVQLPDGTKVWLNAASSLKYAANLNSATTRIVELSGEAYFEVAKHSVEKNAKRIAIPFIVKTINQSIEVMGTHFNVHSYQDEPLVKTTLLEGSVKISIPQSNQSALLKPGQESEVKKTGSLIKISDADIQEAVAWKNGEFVFNEEDLGTIMKEISRWYNVDVEFRDETKKGAVFGGYISKFSSISKVLKMLELTGLAKFSLENNKVIVK